jgi:hypothetical protein
VIPTILIVVGASGVTLLLAEQIYKAKLARAERSSVATQNVKMIGKLAKMIRIQPIGADTIE